MKYLEKVISDVIVELSRQREKWGIQNHSPVEWLIILGEEYGEACAEIVNNDLIGVKTEQSYRKELIQVAAVAISAIENYDKQQ